MKWLLLSAIAFMLFLTSSSALSPDINFCTWDIHTEQEVELVFLRPVEQNIQFNVIQINFPIEGRILKIPIVYNETDTEGIELSNAYRRLMLFSNQCNYEEEWYQSASINGSDIKKTIVHIGNQNLTFQSRIWRDEYRENNNNTIRPSIGGVNP